MALFNDETLSTVTDLLAYESAILEVARVEGIDLTAKLSLAKQEIGLELESFLARQCDANLRDTRTGVGLANVVASEPLHKWHTFQTLSLVYRDAYHRQLNDRYSGKWKEFERLASWAAHKLFDAGLPIVAEPVQQAKKPNVSSVPGPLPATIYYVSVSWLGAGGQEGCPSQVAVLNAPEGSLLVVDAVHTPADATGWNIYAGYNHAELSLQNESPLAIGQPWTQPGELRAGRKAGTGQPAERFLRARQTLQRG